MHMILRNTGEIIILTTRGLWVHQKSVVQQNLLRALILQKNPAGSEAGAGSEAMPQILFEAEAGAPVETEADLRSLPQNVV